MRSTLFSWLVILIFSPLTWAGPVVFPAQGQSEDQQILDEHHCKQWAKERVGVTPDQVEVEPDRQRRRRTMVRGAVKGAARAAVVGAASGGDVGSWAGGGAAAGAMGGHSAARQAEHIEAAAVQQEYMRSFAACMEGKGYTVR